MKEYGNETLNKIFNYKSKEELEASIAAIKDINVKYNGGNTILHKAIKINKYVAYKLINPGRLNLNLQNDKGQTPSHIAVKQNDVCVLNSLVSKGANLMLKDNEGHLPYDLIEYIENDKDCTHIKHIFNRACSANAFWNTNFKCLYVQLAANVLNALRKYDDSSYYAPIINTLAGTGLSYFMINNSTGGFNSLRFNRQSVAAVATQLAVCGINIYLGKEITKSIALISIGVMGSSITELVPCGCC